ncbi:MAG: thioredoxin domain-containing protein [Acidobacteriota bacterium]
MTLAHLLIAAAWSVAMIAVWTSEKLSNKSRRHTRVVVLVTGLVLAVLLVGVDRWMVKEKAAQDANAAATNTSPSETHTDSTAKPPTSVPEPKPSAADASDPLDLEPVYKAPKVEVPRITDPPRSPFKETLPHIVEGDFPQEVLKATKPVLVFFCAEPYESCDQTAPAVLAAVGDQRDKIKLVALDVRINRVVSTQYGATFSTIPLLMIFKDGKPVGQFFGAASKQTVTRLIEKPEDFKIQSSQAREKEPSQKDKDPLVTIPTVPESDFDDEVLKSSIPVLVYFHASFQDACKVVSPLVAQIAESYKGKIKVLQIDSSIHRNISSKYNAGPLSAPVLILFKDGAARGRIKGTTSMQTIARLIERPEDFKIEVAEDRRRVEPEPPSRVSVILAAIPDVLESDFDSEVKSAIPTLVYFYDDDDRVCKLMAPTVVEIAGLYKGRIRVLRLDASINQSTHYRYRAGGSWGPGLLLFRGGKVKDRKDGAFSRAAIVNMIDKVLAAK